ACVPVYEECGTPKKRCCEERPCK
nr:RecName: Full=U3-ctenitoxin-Co1a; Short=U3-CNTX-Co1a; AltName: Full=Neurotoxin Oc F29-9 [Oligoctenus ornatus]